MKKVVASRFAYSGLDRVIHERARLSLLTALASHGDGLSFSELKSFCDLTDGNLSRHLQTLEEAKLIVIIKSLDLNRLQTRCRITVLGRKRFLDYLAVLERVIIDAGGVAAGDASRAAKLKPARA